MKALQFSMSEFQHKLLLLSQLQQNHIILSKDFKEENTHKHKTKPHNNTKDSMLPEIKKTSEDISHPNTQSQIEERKKKKLFIGSILKLLVSSQDSVTFSHM